MYETDRIVQLVYFVSGVRFLAGVRLVFVTSFRIRLFRTWAIHTKGGGKRLVQTGFIHMFIKPGVTKKTREIIHGLKNPGTSPPPCLCFWSGIGANGKMAKLPKKKVKYTVIRFVSASAKFAICTVVGVKGTLDKDKKIKNAYILG